MNVADLRREQLGLCRSQRVLEFGQQLLPVHDRDDTVAAGPIGDIDPVLPGPGRNRAMDAFPPT